MDFSIKTARRNFSVRLCLVAKKKNAKSSSTKSLLVAVRLRRTGLAAVLSSPGSAPDRGSLVGNSPVRIFRSGLSRFPARSSASGDTKLQNPSIDIHKAGKYLMLAVQDLVAGDQCEGRFVFGRESKKPKESSDKDKFTKDGTNPKSLLQTLLMRAGHAPPKYKTKHLKTNEFRALVEFKGMQFVGTPKKNKALAEKEAAIEALGWLTHTTEKNVEEDSSPIDVNDNMLKLLGKRRRSKRR